VIVRLRQQFSDVGSVDAKVAEELGLGGSLADHGSEELPVIHVLLVALECRAALMLERQQARSW